MEQNELMHYGVMGMKWGIRRAASKSSQNNKLELKALKYDKKAAIQSKKSENAHSKNDLGTANKKAKKANEYLKKAAKLQTKALKTDNDIKQSNLEKKAETLKYKSAKKNIDADRISKLTGYGYKAMHYSVKSDKFKKKAAKARMTISSNNRYITMMNHRVSTLPKDKQELAMKYLGK